MEIIKKVYGIAALLTTMWISVEAMAYSLLVTTVLSQIVNSWPNKKLLGYSYLQQVRDMLPQITLSAVMGAIVYCVSLLPISEYLILLIQVPLGVMIYFAGSAIFRLESFEYVISVAKSYLKKKRKNENETV